LVSALARIFGCALSELGDFVGSGFFGSGLVGSGFVGDDFVGGFGSVLVTGR